MGEFTKVGDVQPADLPIGEGVWKGLKFGQVWTKRTHRKRNWPLGRVHITDLVEHPDGRKLVTFVDAIGVKTATLTLETFLQEHVR